MSKKMKCLSLLIVMAILMSVTPVYAKDSNLESQVQKSSKILTDPTNGIKYAKRNSEITISKGVIDPSNKDAKVHGNESVTVIEKISYDFYDESYRAILKNEVKKTVFSKDKNGNYYINGEQVNVDEELSPKLDQVTASDTGGHWKYTYFNCSTTQCYMYTGSGVSFNLNEVDDAYKAVYKTINSTNNYTITSFKMYANSAAGYVQDYHNAGAAYALAVGVTIITFASIIGAILAGGSAAIAAYQVYQAHSNLDSAMSSAYSLI